MGHYINNESDFIAVVNGERSEPWHRLGKRAPKCFTAEEALIATNMDWNVELVPLFALPPSYIDAHGNEQTPDPIVLPNKVAVVYRNPHTGELEILGVVGDRYEPVQNRQAFAFMDGIVGDIGGAHYDTAGFLRPPRVDGTQTAQIFLTIDLADAGHVVLDPGGAADELNTKLFCTTSHDGSLALTVGESTTRIVCANTQQMALRNAKRTWKMKHTLNINGRMDEARESMKLVLTYIEQMHAEAEKLIQQAYTDKEFTKLIEQVFPYPKDRDANRQKVSNVERQHAGLRFCWSQSPTIENITGTKWGAYQAVTEYLDWFAPVKSSRNESVRRATNALIGPSAAKKRRTLSVLSA